MAAASLGESIPSAQGRPVAAVRSASRKPAVHVEVGERALCLAGGLDEGRASLPLVANARRVQDTGGEGLSGGQPSGVHHRPVGADDLDHHGLVQRSRLGLSPVDEHAGREARAELGGRRGRGIRLREASEGVALGQSAVVGLGVLGAVRHMAHGGDRARSLQRIAGAGREEGPVAMKSRDGRGAAAHERDASCCATPVRKAPSSPESPWRRSASTSAWNPSTVAVVPTGQGAARATARKSTNRR